MQISLRIALLCAAAVAPSLAFQAWHEISLRQARTGAVHAEAQRFAELSAAELDRVVDGAEQLLTAIGTRVLARGLGPECAEELADLRRRVSRYAAIGLVGPDGRVVCHSHGVEDVSVADRPYFQAAVRTGARSIGTYQTSRGAGAATLPVAVPISQDGTLRLVAVASFDLAWLSASLAANVAVPPGGSITVADAEGTILARTPLPERFVGTRIPGGLRHLLRAEQPGALQVTSQDGTRRVLGYVPVTGGPVESLYVSAGFATEVAMAEIDRASWRAFVLILVALLSALAAAWLFGRLYLRGPLDALLAATRRWAEGDRTARVATPDGWEFGRLATGFNAMADAIAAREAALAASESRLRAVLDQMPVGVVLAELPGGRLVFRNARAAELLGDAAGPGALPAEEPLRQAVREGRATDGLELPLRRPDGTETVIAVSAARVEGAGGPPLAVAAFLDVGPRRHAERQQALLTAELRHRVKNALAVVQAVAAQTLASSSTLEEFKTSFGARLRDLARAQDALFAAADGRVALGWLLQTALAPFAPGAVSLSGPEVPLPARQTLAMALVLHEMATNAAKHGALRPGGGGRLDVSWRLRPSAAGSEVALSWREERPGEAIGVPEAGRGFGARLISRCVAHDLRGHAEWRAEDGALVWDITFPIPAEQVPEMEALAV